MVREAKNLIVGLDVGTSKIVAIVAEVTPEAALNIVGLGTQPSRGLKKGVVVNIEATMGSIQRVLEEAELMADCRISEVYTGVAGSHIRSLNSSGMVAIKEKEVTQADIDRVVDTAVIPIAGDQVTNDIAMTLRTPTKEAEELKVRHGCALRQLANPNEIIEVPGVGERAPRKLSRPMLAEVIEPRIEELYTLVQQ